MYLGNYDLQEMYSNSCHMHLKLALAPPNQGGTEKGWGGWKLPRKRQNDRECLH